MKKNLFIPVAFAVAAILAFSSCKPEPTPEPDPTYATLEIGRGVRQGIDEMVKITYSYKGENTTISYNLVREPVTYDIPVGADVTVEIVVYPEYYDIYIDYNNNDRIDDDEIEGKIYSFKMTSDIRLFIVANF
jgi:hypothetical protein